MARMYNDGIPRYQNDMEVTVLAYGQVVKNGEVVDVDDDLVEMMSGGVLDVDTKMMQTRP